MIHNIFLYNEDMNKKIQIQQYFEQMGYKKVKVHPNLLNTKADVYCKDLKNHKHQFKVHIKKNQIQLKEVNTLDWIDEFEMYSAIFDD